MRHCSEQKTAGRSTWHVPRKNEMRYGKEKHNKTACQGSLFHILDKGWSSFRMLSRPQLQCTMRCLQLVELSTSELEGSPAAACCWPPILWSSSTLRRHATSSRTSPTGLLLEKYLQLHSEFLQFLTSSWQSPACTVPQKGPKNIAHGRW